MGLSARDTSKELVARPRLGGLELAWDESIAEGWRGKVVAWDRVRLNVEGERARAVVMDEWGRPEKIDARGSWIRGVVPRQVELPRGSGRVASRLKARAWRRKLKSGTYEVGHEVRGVWWPRMMGVVGGVVLVMMMGPALAGLGGVVDDFSEMPAWVGAVYVVMGGGCVAAMVLMYMGLCGVWWLPLARRVRVRGDGVEVERRRGGVKSFAWERLVSAREVGLCWVLRFGGDDGRRERVWVMSGNGIGDVLGLQRARLTGRSGDGVEWGVRWRAMLVSVWWMCQMAGVVGGVVVWAMGRMLAALPGGGVEWVWWPDEGAEGQMPHPVVVYVLVGVGLPLMLTAVSLVDRKRAKGKKGAGVLRGR